MSKIIKLILLLVIFVVTHVRNRVIHIVFLRLDHRDQ